MPAGRKTIYQKEDQRDVGAGEDITPRNGLAECKKVRGINQSALEWAQKKIVSRGKLPVKTTASQRSNRV